MVAERHRPASECLCYLFSLLPRCWAERIASSIIQIVSNAIKPIIYSWQLLIFTSCFVSSLFFYYIPYDFVSLYKGGNKFFISTVDLIKNGIFELFWQAITS